MPETPGPRPPTWTSTPVPEFRHPDGFPEPPVVGPLDSMSPPPPPPSAYEPPFVLKPNWPLHISLFLATSASTWLTQGPLYAASIMAILLAHEMGHYVTALRYRVPATPPYFIPLPLISAFGTLGAVIRMATMGADRRMLCDIAAAGPLAGLVLALPACVYGLMKSEIADLPGTAYTTYGSSLLFQWLTDTLVGRPGPGQDVLLHPIAFAGWAGLFVTSLNLIPIGQLDGGHVAYALLGRRPAHALALACTVGLIALAVFVSPTWWAVAIMAALFGLRHAPTSNDWTPIDAKRIIIGVFLLLLFVVTFTPRPIH